MLQISNPTQFRPDRNRIRNSHLFYYSSERCFCRLYLYTKLYSFIIFRTRQKKKRVLRGRRANELLENSIRFRKWVCTTKTFPLFDECPQSLLLLGCCRATFGGRKVGEIKEKRIQNRGVNGYTNPLLPVPREKNY